MLTSENNALSRQELLPCLLSSGEIDGLSKPLKGYKAPSQCGGGFFLEATVFDEG